MKLTFKRNTGRNTPEWLNLLSMDVKSWFDKKERYTIYDLYEFIQSHIKSLCDQKHIRSTVTAYIVEPSVGKKVVVIMRGNAVVQTYYLDYD